MYARPSKNTTPHMFFENLHKDAQFVIRTDAEKARQKNYYGRTDEQILSREYEGKTKTSALFIPEEGQYNEIIREGKTSAVYEIRAAHANKIILNNISPTFQQFINANSEKLDELRALNAKAGFSVEDSNMIINQYLGALEQADIISAKKFKHHPIDHSPHK